MKRVLLLFLLLTLCLSACAGETAPESTAPASVVPESTAPVETGEIVASQPSRKELVESALVGQWGIESDRIDFDLEFYPDHTGIATQRETLEQKEIAWSYDEDADRILLYVQDKAYVYYMVYSNTDGVETLSYSGELFTRK